jgi:hypothetical protein
MLRMVGRSGLCPETRKWRRIKARSDSLIDDIVEASRSKIRMPDVFCTALRHVSLWHPYLNLIETSHPIALDILKHRAMSGSLSPTIFLLTRLRSVAVLIMHSSVDTPADVNELRLEGSTTNQESINVSFLGCNMNSGMSV